MQIGSLNTHYVKYAGAFKSRFVLLFQNRESYDFQSEKIFFSLSTSFQITITISGNNENYELCIVKIEILKFKHLVSHYSFKHLHQDIIVKYLQ